MFCMFVTNFVTEEYKEVRAFNIITTMPKEMSETVMQRLSRGCTCFEAKGMYTGTERHIVLCLISKHQVHELRTIIKEVDPLAFVYSTKVGEILGEWSSFSETTKKSKDNKGRNLLIAINYGGRQEIVHAVNRLIKEGEQITEKTISENLYTAEFGEPDLIIRTGGEKRLSNFLLFQGAYSEFYFTDVLWPDFNEQEFDKAIEEFGARERRFGKV